MLSVFHCYCVCSSMYSTVLFLMNDFLPTHAHTHACTHTRTRTHACTHAHTHTHTHTHTHHIAHATCTNMRTHRHNDTYFHLNACIPKRPTSASTHMQVPIQVVNLTSQVYYLWITKRKKNDSDKDDIDMWSDNEQGANLHQVTLASMQREIDSLKEQLTKANKVTLKASTQNIKLCPVQITLTFTQKLEKPWILHTK